MKLVHFATMLLLSIGLWACSQGNDNTVLLDATNKHPALWAVAATGGSHPAVYLAKPDGCAECHGNDLRGGITNISCFSAARSGINCHPAGPSGHPAGFAAPGLHGVNAKSAAVGMLGMAFCKNCHGADYRGAGSANRDCIGCHKLTTPSTNAPHSPAPWRGGTRTHVTTDPSNAAACATCHSGGANSTIIPTTPAPAGTPPDCFNNTLCHGVVGHPAQWALAANHGASAKTSLGGCQSCHATPASGVNPRFNVAKTNLANGCENCHQANTAHPTPWLTGRVGTPGNIANTTSHATAGSLGTACALCHGAALNGPAGGGTAPSCMSATAISGISCHATSPAANPTGCSSCHGNPPNGATSPNRAFAHTAHTFSNVACAACHNNLGFGSTAHADGTVNVALSPNYQAKTGGAPSYSVAGQCANVSCHGGLPTPQWTTGATIDVNTSCNFCHSLRTTSDQYNSYNSGQHDRHVNAGVVCTECHDTTKLATNHFTRLDTQTMEGPASATIGGGNTSITFYVSGNCTATCHSPEVKIW